VALAVRELELILIARDNASAVIARVGGAMVILGGIITAVGLKGARELGEMTKEAIDFRQEIALAVTQADDLGANIENVTGIVNRVGSNLSVPFEELNEAMFDIFSTFTSDQLSSLEQAEMILKAFGESAVAGQAPVRDIARSTIAWINALDQPATIENITRLLDIQFELVRKGAGEYSEFAGEVGKSIPAFAAANQSVESFAGIMAFLTKNGLNAAMAATSAARAVELMFSPKAISGLKEVGVAVEDSEGKFRAVEDIVRDLVPVMKDLTDAQKKIKFKEIFGTGRIQARRFFDLAIPNFAELEELIGDMEQAGGGVANAFEFMFSQPLSQMELFKNKWEALRRTIGDVFIERLQTTVFPALQRLFDWWDKLTPQMQKQIAMWASYAAMIAIVGGALLMMLGIGLLFVALLKAFSGATAIAGIGKLVASLGWIGIILAIVAGLAYLIWKNWGKIWPFLVEVWGKITEAARQFMENNKEFFEAVRKKAIEIWGKILKLGKAIWERAKAIWIVIWAAMLVFWDRWGDDIMTTISAVWKGIKDTFLAMLDIIMGVIDFFTALFEGDWDAMWEAVKRIGSAAWEYIKSTFETFTAIISQIWRIVWDAVKAKAIEVWNVIEPYLAGVWDNIKSKASEIWNGILDFFKGVWESITSTAKDTIDGKGGLLEFFQNLPGRILDAVFGFSNMLLEWGLGAITSMYFAVDNYFWHTVLPFFADLPMNIIGAMPGVIKWLWDTGWSIVKGLLNGIKWYWNNIVWPFFTDLLPNILRAIGNVNTWLWNTGMTIMRGLWNGILWFWNNLLVPWIEGINTAILKALGDLSSILWNAGVAVIQGFWDGLKDKWKSVKSWLRGLGSTITGLKGPYSTDLKLLIDNGDAIMMGLEKGLQIGFADRIAPLLEEFTRRDIPRSLGSNTATTTNFNENGQVFNFGDIISQADPDEIAQAMAWEMRLV